MKLTAFILLVLCLHVAAKTSSQTISLSGKNLRLEEVLSIVKKQTGYSSLYNEQALQHAGLVSVAVKDQPLNEFLDNIFKDQPLKYVIKNTSIIVSKKSEEKPVHVDEVLGDIPPITVRGRIVNERGEPVIASVTIKGTNRGTTSDANGNFELSNVGDKAVLVITATNIEMITINVNGKNDLSINVKTTASSLNEVVVNKGYYSESRRLSTGNVSKVDAKTIEKQPIGNPIAALQGRVPGLEITQQTGVSGGNFQVRIRGVNSIANGNDPLYIIDGVPYTSTTLMLENGNGIYGQATSPLNSFNPSDISNIEILKDADATAIYGSRGSNGVILITTKKGRPGKTRVDFNYYNGIGKVPGKIDFMDLRQYLDMRYEAFKNDSSTPTASTAPDLILWDTTQSRDWQKELIGGTAKISDIQFSVSGGEKNTTFNIGGGYHKESSVFPGDNADKRISAHANINNASANQRLKTSLSINYSSLFTNLLSKDLTSTALELPPNAPPLLDDKGNLSWTNWSRDFENPLAYTKRPYESVTNSLLANFSISYSLLKDLDIKLSGGYSNADMNATTLTPIASRFPDPLVKNFTTFSNTKFKNWIIEPQISWKRKIAKGDLNILVGTSLLEQESEGLSQSASGFSSEAMMKIISAATFRDVNTNSYTQYRYNAIFGRINYSYDQKYIINITGRRDGSSRFGPGKQFANFGALGAAWIFSDEQFVRNTFGFLSFGKLRASYGTTGNDQLTDYQYLDTYTSSDPYMGVGGLAPVRLNNPDFAWEINKKLEASLDLGFMRDRLLFSFTYYRNRSSSQLVGFPLPVTTGFSSIQGNFPALIQNKGVEIQIESRNIETTEFKWSSSFNISIPKNKLVAFPDIANFPAFAEAYAVGAPLSIKKRYKFLQINSATGLFEVEDVDHNGTYDFKDQQAIVNTGIKYSGGFQNSLQFGGFHLDLLLQYVNRVSEYLSYGTPGSASPQPVDVLNRWQNTQSVNVIYQRYGALSAVNRAASLYFLSDKYIGDASYLRVKNISFSWTLPGSWILALKAEDAKLFLQGQNVLTFTRFNGPDPEVSGKSLPVLRVVTAGFHITF